MNSQRSGMNQIISESVFYITCALTFICAAFHWKFDISYKYIVGDYTDIIDYRFCAAVAAILIIYFIIKNRKVPFDVELIIFLSILLYVGYLDYQAGRNADVCYWYILFVAYLLGRVVLGTNYDTATRRIAILFFALVLGMFTASFLDFSINLENGWSYGTEEWPNFISGDVEPRTTYEYGFVLTTSLFGYAVLFFKEKRWLPLFIVALNVLIQYMVITVEGRENSFMLIISVITVFGLLLLDKYNEFSVGTKKRLGILLIVLLVIVAIIYMLFVNNFLGLYDLYSNSYLSGSGGIIHNVRFEMDLDGFRGMLKYPFEDYEAVAGIRRPHSMILEYGRVYNIIVFAGLTVFRIITFIDVIKLLFMNDGRYRYIKYIIIPAFININLYYSLEPNGYAHRHFWMAGLLLCGMIRAYVQIGKRSRISRRVK